ncbi:MAG TPA: cytochrome P450 [Pseudomonas xinjiangensis]|uniref:Cytochrome P450 n=2 Tax=root TaxID=1 RepID=A0A7V1BL89_9GAMM|nr:cytochrome P450 [Halopseudomonas xinjiangensis]HEC47542.1 cytochrome P450 [Halopseudomonas xinjiangensis]
MAHIPRDETFDCSLAVLNNGYRFISERCERYGSDLFQTRVMMRPVICATGEDAARMFYHPHRFTRKGSMPPSTLMSLQDRGSVQQLDGQSHRHRKQMFMALMSPDSIKQLGNLFEEEWCRRMQQWQRQESVTLHYEMEELLCRAVCRWTGIKLSEDAAVQRTRELAAMIDGAGAIGPRNWKGLVLRVRTERWARKLIEDTRHAPLSRPRRSPLESIALHRDENGNALPAEVAAVELLNILRPTVAVARFITFAALALHNHPQYREKLRDGDAWRKMFTLEVRRFYPFFPLIAGIVKNPFEWKGHQFGKGDWVMLDMYGTNHDSRLWEQPYEFRPERFQNWEGNAFSLIPQGAGEFDNGHRCPGEWITIELIKRALTMLVSGMEYEVPAQNLSIDLSRLPAIPASRFVITKVRER